METYVYVGEHIEEAETRNPFSVKSKRPHLSEKGGSKSQTSKKVRKLGRPCQKEETMHGEAKIKKKTEPENRIWGY